MSAAIAERRRAAKRKKMLNSVARHSLLIAVAIVFLSPFIFVIFTSLMTRDQALTRAIWPHPVPLPELRRRAAATSHSCAGRGTRS